MGKVICLHHPQVKLHYNNNLTQPRATLVVCILTSIEFRKIFFCT